MDIRCPQIDQALLKYLEDAFPDRVEDPATHDPQQAFGRQQVIRHLRMVHEDQMENP